MLRPEYVPPSYAGVTTPVMTLWAASPEPVVQAWVEDAVARVRACLDHRLSRSLHVVVYKDSDDASAMLRRSVPPSALLAPLHTDDLALVGMHAPRSHPLNRDAVRMRRHLCHELAHVHTAEVTGSTKRLGDGPGPARDGSGAWIRKR